MSKNFITPLSTSRFPNRLPFTFQIVELNVDIYGLEPLSLCACRISCLKKFQVSGFKFKVVILRAFAPFDYSLSNKLYERCIVVIVILVLFFLFFLFSVLKVLLLGGE
jgi:hypothetical protein